MSMDMEHVIQRPPLLSQRTGQSTNLDKKED